jgi:hypothetical protein
MIPDTFVKMLHKSVRDHESDIMDRTRLQGPGLFRAAALQCLRRARADQAHRHQRVAWRAAARAAAGVMSGVEHRARRGV